MRIFLMGMPGSGKSTLGQELAHSLKMRFIDLDTEIEKDQKNTVPEIFKINGEDYFREVESEVLTKVIHAHYNSIIALGGGTPCFKNNLKLIKGSGVSIYLDVSVDEIQRRLQKDKNRPLMKVENLQRKIEELWISRDPIYRNADYVISGNSITPGEIQKLINSIS